MTDTPAYKLPATLAPQRYDIRLTPDLSACTFAGEETVAITVREPVTHIVLNAIELTIHTVSVGGPDGQTLYYRSGSQFLAVEVATEPTFAVLSAPEVLFDQPSYSSYQNPGLVRTWDLHPDASRFIMVKSGGEGGAAASTEVYLVTNWFEELRERMGN